MEITVTDDFNLEKIAQSGQCFRVREFLDGTFRFVIGSNILYIKKVAEDSCLGSHSSLYEVSCTKDEWKRIWQKYFDFERNYQSIRDSIPKNDSYMMAAAAEGRGIRILRQDPWEMLITFIVSQRKSIPAIKNSIELLCSAYGEPAYSVCGKPVCDVYGETAHSVRGEPNQNVCGELVQNAYGEPAYNAHGVSAQSERETLHLFPLPEKLYLASEADLKKCKLGYRVAYVKDAARAICEQEIDLTAISQYDDASLFAALKSIKGVGDKVANCICLFAYGRTAMAPVDTWISKIIEHKYKGVNPFPAYGDSAGIMQQYAFFYAQNHKKDL